MIRASGLRRQFGDFVAVADLSLEVGDGTLLALLGQNGAGKTTTVRMLAGLLAPSGGSACVAGRDVASDPAGVRSRVGLVTDVPGLYEQMSPWAYLEFFGRLYGLDQEIRRKRIGDLLELFELGHRRNDRMVTFSRGMQQKVALARALLHEPSVLFLDEPTAGLDPLAARGVRELVLRMKHARRSIVLCTHDLDEAERLADRVAILHGGRIVAMDTPANLRQRVSPRTQVRITLAPPFPASAPDGFVDFDTADPVSENPEAVAQLVAEGGRVVSVTCETRSLEDVYASAVNGEMSLLASAPFEDSVPVEPPTLGEAESVIAVSDWSALWLIAVRGAVESLNDRMTRVMNVFFALVAPILLLALVIRPVADQAGALGPGVLAFYLLVIGMMPAVGAVGIAAGQFAGERERGVLTPLLASPASNLAIFGGKVLASVLPPVLYSAIAQVIYLGGIAVLLGFDRLRQLPLAMSLAMILLVPLATCLAAIVGTLVSSRVRTYNAAQQIAGIVLLPLWAVLFGVGFRLAEWGNAALAVLLVALIVVDAALVRFAAATWRREEVLSQR